jgi:hypothetical protein
VTNFGEVHDCRLLLLLSSSSLLLMLLCFGIVFLVLLCVVCAATRYLCFTDWMAEGFVV